MRIRFLLSGLSCASKGDASSEKACQYGNPDSRGIGRMYARGLVCEKCVTSCTAACFLDENNNYKYIYIFICPTHFNSSSGSASTLSVPPPRRDRRGFLREASRSSAIFFLCNVCRDWQLLNMVKEGGKEDVLIMEKGNL